MGGGGGGGGLTKGGGCPNPTSGHATRGKASYRANLKVSSNLLGVFCIYLQAWV